MLLFCWPDYQNYSASAIQMGQTTWAVWAASNKMHQNMMNFNNAATMKKRKKLTVNNAPDQYFASEQYLLMHSLGFVYRYLESPLEGKGLILVLAILL